MKAVLTRNISIECVCVFKIIDEVGFLSQYAERDH